MHHPVTSWACGENARNIAYIAFLQHHFQIPLQYVRYKKRFQTIVLLEGYFKTSL